LFREDALALHAGTKLWIIQFAAANCTDSAEHFFFFARSVSSQPILEQWSYSVRQPKNDVTGKARPGLGGSRNDRRHFVIGQPGNHWSHQHTDGTPAAANALIAASR
jgi:hypothetical protein